VKGAIEDTRPRKGFKRFFRPLILYLLIPALLVAITASYVSFVDFVERDPGFCAQCHETRSEYTLWTKSEHRNIVCQECHHQSRREGLEVLFRFVARGEQVKGAGETDKFHSPQVPINACARCHVRHDKNWPQIDRSEGHRVHVEKGGVSCMRCHARSIHKFAGAIDACAECHEARALQTSGMERLHCVACHNFLTQEETIKPARRICLECHQSSGILHRAFPENAPMATFACWACHRPHKDEHAEDVACTTCHDQMERQGLHRRPEHADCIRCHEAHGWVTARKQCTACHRPMVSHFAHKACWSCHSFKLEEGGGP
jgi:hypothetical protein